MKEEGIVTRMIDAVRSFKGDKAREHITAYYKNVIEISKARFFRDEREIDIKRNMYFVARHYTKRTFKKEIDDKLIGYLCNAMDYAKSGNIDAIHTFIVVRGRGTFYLTTEGAYKMNGINAESELSINKVFQTDLRGDGLGINEIPAYIVMFGEHQIKTVKYLELGYDYMYMEAGMIMQNIYKCPLEGLAILPLGSYDKDATNEVFGLKKKNFTPLITIAIGYERKEPHI